MSDLLVPYNPARKLRSSNKALSCVPEVHLKTRGDDLQLEPLRLGRRTSLHIPLSKEQISPNYFTLFIVILV